MNTVTLHFRAEGQKLIPLDGIYNYASNTVEYIRAVFELGENWTDFDVVRAAWFTDYDCIVTVLDTDGVCVVPAEVLNKRAEVCVNLFGCDVDEDELVNRLTTYPIKAVLIDANARVCGSETAPITPSQFEQFIEIVEGLVGSVKDIERCVLNADYTLTIYYSDGTSDTVGPIRGEQGATGPAGNGISSIAKIGSTGTNPVIDTYRITYTNGTHTDFTVTNGLKGDTGATGNGIESVYLTATHGAVKTYTILFTDGSTYDFNVTDGEVTNAVLEQVLPTDTASGSIASFPDGSDLFDYLSCIVDIDPVQDLHGYDKPWAGGAGKNKFSRETINVTAYEEYTVDSIPAGTYVFSTVVTSTNTSENVVIAFKDADGNTLVSKSIIPNSGTRQTTTSFTTNAPIAKVGLYSGNGWAGAQGHTSVWSYNMVADSSVTSYEPYSNICPVTGWTGCEVDVVGLNIWNEECEQGGLAGSTGQPQADNTRIRPTDFIPIVPSKTYYIKAPTNIDLFWYDINNAFISRDSAMQWSVATSPSNAKYMKFQCGYSGYPLTPSTYGHDISINYPSSDHDYHAYNPNSAFYPITWQTEAGTVYGGTLDIVSGVLTVTKAIISLGSLNWLYMSGQTVFYSSDELSAKATTCISNIYAYTNASVGSGRADFTINVGLGYFGVNKVSIKDTRYTDPTALKQMLTDTDAKLCYDLATEQTYQLSPQTVACLLGQNNVWANCGDIEEVQYKADVQLYIEKMLNP